MTAPLHTEFRVCLFGIAGRRFGLRLESVKEIVPMAALARPPSMPAILEGFLNLRGTAVPVLKMATLLGLAQDPLELHTPLVILRPPSRTRASAAGDELTLALLVHRAIGIVTVPAGDLLPIAATDSFNGCVEGRLASNGSDLLSLDRLLLAKEQKTLADFQGVESRRLQQIGQHAS